MWDELIIHIAIFSWQYDSNLFLSPLLIVWTIWCWKGVVGCSLEHFVCLGSACFSVQFCRLVWTLTFKLSVLGMYKSISKRFFLIEKVPPWSWTWKLPGNGWFWKPCSMLSFRVVLLHYVVTSPKNVNFPSGLLGFWNGPTFFRGLMSKMTPQSWRKNNPT